MNYVPVIGLEVHLQLNTKTKLFSHDRVSFGDPPNVNTSVLCTALPGSLPVLNQEALDKAILAGIALRGTIHRVSKFDRKNYFYPDLPKGYQISQYYEPYCTKGKIEIDLGNGNKKDIGITRVHIEEDAGKLIHSEDDQLKESYVDLNRAGTPLIEIVSEPDISSSQEAYMYLNELKNIMEYIDVSDCNMEQGSLRCDANVSVKESDSPQLGTRVEIKNLNTFKGVKAAIEYEINRQIELLSSHEEVVQETCLWNASLNQTFPMRSKEESHDYRYFPDPDLSPIELKEEDIQRIRNTLPELAYQKRERFMKEYQLPEYDIKILTSNRKTADYFEETVKQGIPDKKASNWIISEMMAITSEKKCQLADLFPAIFLAELIEQIECGNISGKIGKNVMQEMINTSQRPKDIIQKKGLMQISDEGSIQKLVEEVISENESSVSAYKKGKERALGYLVGQVMQKSKGKANPPIVNKLLIQKLKSM